MSQEVANRRRGPKTAVGKLTVSTNAKTHGITSPRPVVTSFESEKDWKEYRKSIIDSLAPENGIEQALAERVALASWRLNRVIAYETQRIQARQDEVLEEMERPPLVGDPSPKAVTAELEEAHRVYDMVCSLFDPEENGEATISRDTAEWVFDRVVEEAVEFPSEGEEEDPPEELIETRINVLYDRLEERVDAKESFTPKELHNLVAWVAEEANVPETRDADGKVVYSPSAGLLEKLHTLARYDLGEAEKEGEKVEEQIIDRRRLRMLPRDEELHKIARYEAHLSREMYRALHELEALQTRRSGGSAPLGRLDVST